MLLSLSGLPPSPLPHAASHSKENTSSSQAHLVNLNEPTTLSTHCILTPTNYPLFPSPSHRLFPSLPTSASPLQPAASSSHKNLTTNSNGRPLLLPAPPSDTAISTMNTPPLPTTPFRLTLLGRGSSLQPEWASLWSLLHDGQEFHVGATTWVAARSTLSGQMRRLSLLLMKSGPGARLPLYFQAIMGARVSVKFWKKVESKWEEGRGRDDGW